MLPKHYKVWAAVVAACFATLLVGAVVLPKSFALTALSDILQAVLLLSATLSLVPHIRGSRGRLRLFWVLIAAGVGLWFCYQLMWVYFEILLRADVPDLCAGDMILFLHIVPFIAALALRPHAQQDEYAARLRYLDFALLMVWWVYLYVLIVIPWQYAVPNVVPYNDNLNLLYSIEKFAFLGGVALSWWRSQGGWRKFYGHFFGASLTYAASSDLANWAIARKAYYSGSLYDIPLAISMVWIAIIGFSTEDAKLETQIRPTSAHDGVLLARAGMIAAFSLPIFGAWAAIETRVPTSIRSFRVELTLAAVIVMGIMVFMRQRLLDRELLRLLTRSQPSIDNLKHLQTQIAESEKLASIGQLVAGAAHELNNPIAAMLGYSDLLALSKPLSPEQSDMAAKIGQHARRTKSLVASLLSFAKPAPATFAPVDLKTVLRTAAKLSQSQWRSCTAEVSIDLPDELLLVRGDSNQILQVLVQLINDVLRATDARAKTCLKISARSNNHNVVIEISGNAKEAEQPHKAVQVLSSLGRNACQAILHQHNGVLRESVVNGGASITIELPLISAPQEKSSAAMAGRMETQAFS